MTTARTSPQPAGARPPTRTLASPPTITRAITLVDPWAWLVVSDFIQPGLPVKPVENRNWPAPSSQRGYVAIHTSSNWNQILDTDLMGDIFDMHPAIAEHLERPAILAGKPDSYNMPFHVGCIVGAVEIFDCLTFDEGDDFEQLCRARGHGEWYDSHEIPPIEWASGLQCFLLRNPIQFVSPIPAVGALNFWHLDNPRNPGLTAAVAAALRRPLGDPVAYRAALHAAGKPAPMPNEETFASSRKKARK